ncbi:MFS transporter [Dactylosporangium sp. NPDC051484]|uniref:MFS transporter n=1 Tax=Dactylosporangium sp. NPDC051484 TaxID=3154942 RepID=UPI003450A36F
MANDAVVAPDISVTSSSAVPPDPRRWLALAVIAVAQLMVVLDATIVNIALPSAQEALDISTADRQWIVTAYTLTFGGLLLLGGRIADYFGRKRTLLIGLLGFAGASALGGAAVNAGTLFAARGLQGVFGALLAPAALSLITVTFTEARERAKAFGVFGAISGGGAAIGLLAGGVLTEYADWRWCLLVNIPIAVLAFAAAVPLVRESKAQGDTRYDIPGAVLATAGQVALVYGFTKAATDGWSSAVTITWLASAVVLLGVFGVWESRTSHPLLPLRVLFDRNRGVSYLVSILLGAGMLGMFLFMTFYLQQTLGWSAMKSGVAYMPFSAGIIAAAVIASRLLPRTGPKLLMSIGGVLATASMIYLTRLDLDSSYATDIMPSFIAMSLGMGLVFVPLSSLALSGVANHDAGVASAMVNATQQVGGSLGTALLNTIFTTAVAGYVTGHAIEASRGPAAGQLMQAHAAIHGYNVAFTASAVLMAVATILIIALVRNTTTDRTTSSTTSPAEAAPVHFG